MKRLYALALVGLLSGAMGCSNIQVVPDASTGRDLSKSGDVLVSPDQGNKDPGVVGVDAKGDANAQDPGENGTDILVDSDVFDVLGDTVRDTIQDNGHQDQDMVMDTSVDEGASCTPESCETLNKECGTWPDGCGGQVDCGQCGLHQACEQGKCQAQPFCGDGTCQADEDCASCPADCGSCCGNGQCQAEFGENCATCAVDCGCKKGDVCYQSSCCTPRTCQDLSIECGQASDGCGGVLDCGSCGAHEVCVSGKCQAQPYCGDGTCQADENCASCPADCGGCCGNGQCQAELGENCATCAKDCGCKNGDVCYQSACCTPRTCQDLNIECGQASDGCGGILNCSCGEHQACVSGKCVNQPYCGDKTCNNGENCHSCPGDCGSCCGNGKCEPGYGENCGTCAADCGCAAGLSCVNNTCTATYPPDDPNELIRDRHFSKGFIAINPKTGATIKTMPSGLVQGAPVWQLALGYSKSTLYNQPLQTLADGSVTWQDIYGSITIGAPGTPESDLISDVEGYVEYGGVYYVPSAQQGWVYHLAQQQISYPGNYNTGSPPMSAIARLDFHAFAQLLKADRNQRSGYNSTYHAAQYLVYFTVQNQNTSSPGFGDYLWFGITFYDDRYDVPIKVIMQDKGGTERLIYNVGGEPFITHGLKVGGPGQTFQGDILPAMRDALLRAWDNGFLTGSNVLSDYRIGGMNIGWEVSGLNNVSMRVKDLSLRYTRRPVKPVVFGFNTDGDREGWTLTNGQELTNGPSNGMWIFKVPGPEPMLTSPELSIEAATHPIVRIKVANDHGPADKSYLKVYWDRFGDRGLREAWNRMVHISNGGGTQTVTIDMSNTPGWVGEIHQIRVDPVLGGDGHAVGIDEIAILPAQ